MTMIAVRPSAAEDVAQQPAQRRGGGDVERRHRFVEQQQPRFRGQRAGDGDPLRLAARELGGPPVGEVCRVDRLEPTPGGGRAPPTGTGPCTAARRRHWRRRSCAGTASPAVTASPHPAHAPGTKVPVLVSVTTVPPSTMRPSSGRSRPAIISSSVDLPTPLGPSTASTSPSSSATSNSTPRCARAGVDPDGTHSGPASRRLAEAITITAATTMSSKRQCDGGVGIGLALQVDLQRQRARDALQRAGEGQRRPELAERPRERQHRARHQPGQHERQRHGPQHGGGTGAESGGDVLVAGSRRAQRAFEADHEEGQRDEGLGEHHRGGREGDPDAQQRRVAGRAAPAGRRCTAGRCRRPPEAAQAEGAPERAAPTGREICRGPEPVPSEHRARCTPRCWRSRSSNSKPVRHARIRK